MPDREAGNDRKSPALSPPFHLLCACIAWPPSPQRDAAVAAACASIDDWGAFLDLLARHRVEGLALSALQRVASHVPQNVLSALSISAARLARRALILAAALGEISAALESEDIPFLTVKGTPLAVIAYGNIGIRHAKDVDILVRPADFARTVAVLKRLGFKRTVPDEEAGPNLLRLWSALRKDHAFQDGRIELEVHWRLTDNPFLLSLPWDPSRWRTVAVTSRNSVRTLEPGGLFAYLCVHGAVVGWVRLKWLADIGALLSQETPAGIRALFETARSLGVERAAGQALLLSAQLLQAPVPHDLLAELSADRVISGLARGALHSLIRDGSRERDKVAFGTARAALSRFRLVRSWRFKLREAVYNIANPFDAIETGFPDSLMYLYPLLRPFVWLRMQLKMPPTKQADSAERRTR